MGSAPALRHAASLQLCSPPSAMPVTVRPHTMLAAGPALWMRSTSTPAARKQPSLRARRSAPAARTRPSWTPRLVMVASVPRFLAYKVLRKVQPCDLQYSPS
eukprot:4198387-Pyramimonas_sp.AAC.1